MKVSVTDNTSMVVDGMAGASRATVVAVLAVVVRSGARLEGRVKRNASGRPGPNAPTGDYRRSLRRRTERRKNSARTSVGSAHPASRRLELGFVGTDALGRVYDQPPFPHLGPGLDAEAPDFERDIRSAIAQGQS